MNKWLVLLFIALGLWLPGRVSAQYCAGTVTEGTASCPNYPDTLNWTCNPSRTVESCAGKSYAECIAIRPTATYEGMCGKEVPICTGCGWQVSGSPPPGGNDPPPCGGAYPSCSGACSGGNVCKAIAVRFRAGT